MLEKTLESPLDCKEIKPVNHKGNQPWIFTGRIDAEAEASILWPPNAKSRLIGKDPDAGKDLTQEKGRTEDEIVGWHHAITNLMDMSLSKIWEMVKDREAWHAAIRGVAKSQTRLNNNIHICVYSWPLTGHLWSVHSLIVPRFSSFALVMAHLQRCGFRHQQD